MKEIKIGIIGFGTVGSGVAANIIKNNEVIARRTGIKLVLDKIADLDITSDRGVKIPENVLTTDAMEVIESSDVVVELVGGCTVAKTLIIEALKRGKPVVTANKALLAEHGDELFAVAKENSVDIYYEASVAGGIPVIKALREGFASNRIEKIYGIMNGTCNYILTRMENEGLDFESILKDAQALGYAEAEPSLDIDGVDTAHKAAILSSLAYGEWFGMEPLYVEGIRNIELQDVKFADDLGYRIKLLAIIKQHDGQVEVRIHPTLVAKNTMLANISDVFNGVMITGDTVGESLLYGRGAGRDATASAVVADLIDVALNLKFSSYHRVPAFRSGKQFSHLISIDQVTCRYYLRLQVEDKAGVIAQAANILGSRNISISSFIQREGDPGENVSLLIITHEACEKDMKAAVNEMQQIKEVKEAVKLYRIEDI